MPHAGSIQIGNSFRNIETMPDESESFKGRSLSENRN